MLDMMKTINTGAIALIICALLLASSLSHANRYETASANHTCDSLSPSLVLLGHQYYYLTPDPVSVTAKEVAQLEALYDRLQGRWKGKWTDQYCKGSGKTARLIPNSRKLQRVDAQIRDHGQLSFRADGLAIDLATASNLTSLEIVDENTLVMTQRYQRGTVLQENQARHAALRERHDTLTLLGKELHLETRWYINGFYSGSELATLRKVR